MKSKNQMQKIILDDTENHYSWQFLLIFYANMGGWDGPKKGPILQYSCQSVIYKKEILSCLAQIGRFCHFKWPTKNKQTVSTNISLSALSIKYGKKVYLDNLWCMFVAKMSDTKFICYIIYVASMYIIVCLCMATTGLVNYF